MHASFGSLAGLNGRRHELADAATRASAEVSGHAADERRGVKGAQAAPTDSQVVLLHRTSLLVRVMAMWIQIR